MSQKDSLNKKIAKKSCAIHPPYGEIDKWVKLFCAPAPVCVNFLILTLILFP